MIRVGLSRRSVANRSPGISPSFELRLGDLGAGVVDTTSISAVAAATFTRATSAWTNLSDGTIGLVASGSPRSYYSPTGTYLGYLAEGARTNLCQRGEDFATVWTDVGTPTLSAGTTTLGALSLSTVGDDSAAALEGKIQTITFTGDAVKAISVYVKQGTSTSSVIRVRDTTAPADRLLAVITWSGSVPVVTMTTGTDLTGTPQQHGSSGVYRLSFATTSVTAANTNSLQLYPATDAALAVTGTGTIEWGGVQAEDATFASSLIRTPGSATVTRNADVLSYPLTGWFNAVAGTLFVQATWLSGSVALTQAAANINNNSTTDYISLEKFNANAVGGIVTASVTQAAVASTAMTAGVTAKGALAYAANDAAGSYNAGTVGTDATVTLPTVAIFAVGNDNGQNNMFGAVAKVSYFPQRLPDATLQALTA